MSSSDSSFLRQLSSKEGWKSTSKRWGWGGGSLKQMEGIFSDYDMKKKKKKTKKKRVMVVVDQTSHSKHAMMWALTHLTNNADILTLLHIVSPADQNHSSSFSNTPYLATTLGSLCKASKPEVEVEALVIQGPKMGTVISQVKKLEVSVLVLGQKKKPSPLVSWLCTDNMLNLNSSESIDDFEQRIFGDGSRPSSNAFYRQLDKAEKKAHGFGMGNSYGMGNKPSFMGGLDGHSTLFDGKDDDLKRAATYFEFDFHEVLKEDYAFRPDVNFLGGMTYDTKDLDLRKPGVRKPARRLEFETTTEDVLLKADFRNVEFLANFITEAGVIIKRSKTGISAKAQRKVAREIKTARAFV
ncbi:hypothetical protein OROGR_026431 [Orobanche gracilis]